MYREMSGLLDLFGIRLKNTQFIVRIKIIQGIVLILRPKDLQPLLGLFTFLIVLLINYFS
tara:strand:+ start:278 stop:457 length:180 start_codon:yes stop_codon:yes gene_type:complete